MLSPHFNIPQERNALRNNFIGSVFLHSLRHAYLEQGQDVLENLLDAQAQIYSRRAQVLVVAVDAAGVVELVEEGRKVYAVARDARGVVVLRGEDNLVGERRQMPDYLTLLGRGEHPLPVRVSAR